VEIIRRRMLTSFELFDAVSLFIWCGNAVPKPLLLELHPWSSLKSFVQIGLTNRSPRDAVWVKAPPGSTRLRKAREAAAFRATSTRTATATARSSCRGRAAPRHRPWHRTRWVRTWWCPCSSCKRARTPCTSTSSWHRPVRLLTFCER